MLHIVTRYAALIFIPLMLGILIPVVYHGIQNKDEGSVVFAVSKGNKGYMELNDGSKVWLNSSSRLVYNAEDSREAYLEGEAYFEIAHDPDNTFRIKTENFDIVVYGTSFNASVYKSDSIAEIDLIEGSIGIMDGSRNLFKLKSGQSVVYDRETKQYTIIEKNISDVSLWTQSELVIRDLTAEQLYRKLSVWYNVNIVLNNNDPNDRLYNLVVTDEPLESILNLINKLSPLDYTIKGKEVTIDYVN